MTIKGTKIRFLILKLFPINFLRLPQFAPANLGRICLRSAVGIAQAKRAHSAQKSWFDFSKSCRRIGIVDHWQDRRLQGYRYGNGAPGGALVSEMAWRESKSRPHCHLTDFYLTDPLPDLIKAARDETISH
ncbi:MAG: hypothetical protein PVF49_08380 [Anaerolineales bacterium]